MIGNLTRAPELRWTPDGDAVCSFDLAVNRRLPKQDGGEAREEVLFMKVTAWRKLAESCGNYLKKGNQVLVDGRLREHKWQDREGNKRSRIETVAETVVFLTPRSNGAPEEGAETPS
jgi:single-strand DNA-binding protein